MDPNSSVIKRGCIYFGCKAETFSLSVGCKSVYLLQEADSDPTGEAADKTQQLLTYYELDLGLNHVVRKFSEQLEEHANFLISGNKTTKCPVFGPHLRLIRVYTVCLDLADRI